MKPAPEPTVSLSKGAPPIIKSWEKAIIDLGKSLPISCLCCGQMVTPEISAVWKSENPDAVVCMACRDARYRIAELEGAIQKAYKMLPHPSPAGEVLYLAINPEN